MPGKGYSTIGLKPSVLKRLHQVTDVYYPGMFLPSTLIIIMTEIKQGRYTPSFHNIKVDLTGKYNSLTIRSDIKEWLEENYTRQKDSYSEKYQVDSFAQFVNYFLINIFESKNESQDYVVRLHASDFKWLIKEYKKQMKNTDVKHDALTFDVFADEFLRELLEKVHEAKKILST